MADSVPLRQLTQSCNRLLKNVIICWNYLYWEKMIERADPKDQESLLKSIKTHSPMSWAHINMLGEYDFSEEKMADTHGILAPK